MDFLLGRFHGKLHSRSFPELSENVKEKQPVRQMSDNQPSITLTKLGGSSTRLPVASTRWFYYKIHKLEFENNLKFIFRLPNVETNSKNNTQSSPCKNPYSFAPNFKQKSQRGLQSSDSVFGESIGEISWIKKLGFKSIFCEIKNTGFCTLENL